MSTKGKLHVIISTGILSYDHIACCSEVQQYRHKPHPKLPFISIRLFDIYASSLNRLEEFLKYTSSNGNKSQAGHGKSSKSLINGRIGVNLISPFSLYTIPFTLFILFEPSLRFLLIQEKSQKLPPQRHRLFLVTIA